MREGRIQNVDLAVKLFKEVDDPNDACQKLQQELDLYQHIMHPLVLPVGITVPRLMAWHLEQLQDPMLSCYKRLPMFALELLPVSLCDVEDHRGAFDAFECQSVSACWRP